LNIDPAAVGKVIVVAAATISFSAEDEKMVLEAAACAA
jgi:hypothetical protein